MSDSNAEELRALLQNQSFQAPPTPNASRKDDATDIPVLGELAALIGSLDSSMPTPSTVSSRIGSSPY